MTGVQHIEIQSDQDGMRVDRWFRSLFPSLRQGDIEKMLRKGQIRVDGTRVKSNTRLVTGQMVRVPPVPQKPQTSSQSHNRKTGVPEALRQQMLDAVIHMDDDILVLNKPSGLDSATISSGSDTAPIRASTSSKRSITCSRRCAGIVAIV